MDRTQRFIVILLIVAILFSVSSVFVSLFASTIEPEDRASRQVQSVGGGSPSGVGLVVERPTSQDRGENEGG